MKKLPVYAVYVLLLWLLVHISPVTAVADDRGTVTLPSSVKIIKEEAFYGVPSIDKVVIPEGTTEIHSRAFVGCSLTEVVLPSTLTYIATDAFDVAPEITVSVPKDCYAYERCTELGLNVKVKAEPTPVEYFTYTISNNEVTITGFDESCGITDVVVPEIIEGCPVTSIKEYVFQKNKSLNSIVLPDGITSIGDYAFQECTSLTVVMIPDNVTSIGWGAFYQCGNLNTITMPDTLTSIGSFAFSNCRSLTALPIPDSVLSIGDGAFDHCTSLLSITIPDGVTSIGYRTFDWCTSLTSVTIPGRVTSIGSEAFRCCEHLTSIIIPDGVTSIGDSVFVSCDSLISVTIPDSVTSLGKSAFADCINLTSVKLPASISSLADGMFRYCSSLTSITIPSGVTSIGDEAFYCCSSLVSIAIPDSVASIGDEAFYCCSSLVSITIPDGVTGIGRYTFKGCTNLTSITIPGSVISVGERAFADCHNLVSVAISEGLTSIGRYAFVNCTSLASISLPDSLSSIDSYAFQLCTGLDTITLPDHMARIGWGVFWGCSSMSSITIPEGITCIESDTFYGCESLSSITIPEGITRIQSNAFHDCGSLTSITIPESVTSIENGAFLYCKSLTSISIPENITSLESSTFLGCNNLASVTIPAGVTSIGENVFCDCSDDLVIYGEPGSYAETYANENGISFSTDPFPGDLEDDLWCVLSGRVALSDGTPLSAALVTLYQDSSVTAVASTYTDAKGEWSIPKLLPNTTYRISCYLPPLTFEDVYFVTADVAGEVPAFVANTGADYLLTSSNVIRAGAEASASKLRIISSGDWTAVTNVDWLTLSQSEGTLPGQEIEVSIQANAENLRVGYIQVAAEDMTVSIPVVQLGELGAALAKPTITTPAEDGLELPYDSVLVEWTEVENAGYYVISLRDLTTDTLLIHHEKQAVSEACKTLLPAEYFFMGREYRIAVGAVPPGLDSTDSTVAWSERTFHTPAAVVPDGASIMGRVCEYEYVSEEVDENGTIITEATINVIPLENVTVDLYLITATDKVHSGSVVTGSDGMFTFTECDVRQTYIIELTSANVEFTTISKDTILQVQTRTGTTANLENAAYVIETDAGDNMTGDITGVPKLGDGHQSWYRKVIKNRPHGLWAEYFQFKDGEKKKEKVFSGSNKRWEYGYSPYDFVNGTLKSQYMNSYIESIDFRWEAVESSVNWFNSSGTKYDYLETTEYDGSGTGLRVRYVSAKNFAAFFNGYLQVPIDDVYTFRLTGDDGIELSLLYAVVRDGYEELKEYGGKKWYNGFAKSITTKGMSLKAGTIMPLCIWYYNHDGVAKLKFEYKTKSDGTWRIVPAEWLYMGGRAYEVDGSWIQPAVTMDQIDTQVHAAFENMADQVIGDYIDGIVSENIKPNVFAAWDDGLAETWVQEIMVSGYQGVAKSAFDLVYKTIVKGVMDPSTLTADQIWRDIVDALPYIKDAGEIFGLDTEAVGTDSFSTLVKFMFIISEYDPDTYQSIKVVLNDLVLYDQLERSVTGTVGSNVLLETIKKSTTAGKLVTMLNENYQRVKDEMDMNRLRSYIHLTIKEQREAFEGSPPRGPIVDGMNMYQRMTCVKVLEDASFGGERSTRPLPDQGSGEYYVSALDNAADFELKLWFDQYYNREDVEVMLYKQLLIDTISMSSEVYGEGLDFSLKSRNVGVVTKGINAIQIIEQPQDQCVVLGEKATFAVRADGDLLKYQWYQCDADQLDWRKIDDATSASYTTEAATQICDGRRYMCRITDVYGNEAESVVAVLYVENAVILPDTGDDAYPLLWLMACALSAIGILIMIRSRKVLEQ